jgi:hypothetical protein
MSNDVDAHAAERADLLAPVVRLCEEAGVAVRLGEFTGRFGPPVRAILCEAEDGSWDAAVTVVRAQRHAAGNRHYGSEFGRDPRTGYDLRTQGELVYELQVHELDDGIGGHGPRPLVVFNLCATAQAVADQLILWVRRASLFAVSPPRLDVHREERRERKCFDHREAAAAHPIVDVRDTPPGAEGELWALDPASLAWHFPRDRMGRFARKAVVLLFDLEDRAATLRSRWLTARADGESLVVSTEDLIAANQLHRWDVTPWLWDRRAAHTPDGARWQAADPAEVAQQLTHVRAGEPAEALRLAGVRVDDQLGALLAGRPTRAFRAEKTATWVANLHAGLADVAPWRLAHAYRTWRDGRTHRRSPDPPITLFGLGGAGTARKPKVALELAGDAALLSLYYTAGNAVLARELWTVPPDLSARLRGWV